MDNCICIVPHDESKQAISDSIYIYIVQNNKSEAIFISLLYSEAEACMIKHIKSFDCSIAQININSLEIEKITDFFYEPPNKIIAYE